MNGKRKLIGKYSSLAAREAIYEAEDGFDIESHAGYEVIERRVLFNDVLFVTLHRSYGAPYLIVTGSIALFFLMIAMIVFGSGEGTSMLVPALIVGAFGLPALISFALRALFGVDTITIFGRRSKASVGFRLRKKRARIAYERVCTLVRDAQASATPESVPHAAS